MSKCLADLHVLTLALTFSRWSKCLQLWRTWEDRHGGAQITHSAEPGAHERLQLVQRLRGDRDQAHEPRAVARLPEAPHLLVWHLAPRLRRACCCQMQRLAAVP